MKIKMKMRMKKWKINKLNRIKKVNKIMIITKPKKVPENQIKIMKLIA